jgi:hypothetical protein
MKRLHTVTAVPAVLLCSILAFAGSALAQQAAAPQAAANGEEAAEAGAQRTVSARELLTPEERRSLRRQFEQATPEQRQQLWAQTRAELAQRASQRGLVLAEPGSRSGGEGGAGRGERAEAGRGEGGGPAGRLIGRAPPAP